MIDRQGLNFNESINEHVKANSHHRIRRIKAVSQASNKTQLWHNVLSPVQW